MLIKTKIILVGFLLLFIVGLEAKKYPEWFLYPRQYSNIVVGYNYRGGDSYKDAAVNYCVTQKCFVLGKQHYYSDTEKKFSDYFYYYDKVQYDIILDSLVYLQTFLLNTLTGDYVAAFSFFEDTLATKLVDSNDGNLPVWLTKNFYREGKYYYGVGMYTSQGNDVDAWKTAEEESYFAIMTGYHIDLEGIKKIYKDDNYDFYFREQILKFKYELKNIELIERFDKSDEKLFYVLSRIHVNDIRKIGVYHEK